MLLQTPNYWAPNCRGLAATLSRSTNPTPKSRPSDCYAGSHSSGVLEARETSASYGGSSVFGSRKLRSEVSEASRTAAPRALPMTGSKPLATLFGLARRQVASMVLAEMVTSTDVVSAGANPVTKDASFKMPPTGIALRKCKGAANDRTAIVPEHHIDSGWRVDRSEPFDWAVKAIRGVCIRSR